jgi:integrase
MLLGKGWEETLSHYKPDNAPPEPEEELMTVGRYIAAVAPVSEARPRTLNGYFVSLRRVAAGVRGLEGQKNGKGDAEALRKAIDDVPLAELTREKVMAWKMAYVARAGADPVARGRAEISCNSILRQAKSLFSQKKILDSIPNAAALNLPFPLPFVGVPLWKQKVMPYKSRVDPEILVSNAAKDLGAVPAMGEPWKIFLLALCCGLRKSEIDYLEWRQIDLKAGEIQVEKTAYFRPKSDDSEGLVDIDGGVVAVLKAAKEKATGAFVIESPLLPKGPGKHPRYRAEEHFNTLNAWLRGQGITARKPLHELRKEAGSMVAKLQGLFAAQTFLRHSTPQITAAYYVSKKERFSTGLGTLLGHIAEKSMKK